MLKFHTYFSSLNKFVIILCPERLDILLMILSMDHKTEGASSKDFLVIGHRGVGMNKLGDERFQRIRENTLKSFNEVIKNGANCIEFDVQVTKDDKSVLFHDDFIISNENGHFIQRRIEELTLEEFMSYGVQRSGNKTGTTLYRRDSDEKIKEWTVKEDDDLCTLEQAFQVLDESLGFNIELKFEDKRLYEEERLQHVVDTVLKEVHSYAKKRRIFFSSFHPDVVLILRKMQTTYPVFFLTKGGTQIFTDPRRNTLEAAIEISLRGGLQGIVAESKAIFKNPSVVARIKKCSLKILTYGQLNNSAEAVYVQHLVGVDGVIVDFVKDIMEAVNQFINTDGETDLGCIKRGNSLSKFPTNFSPRHLTFIMKLMAELIQNNS